MRTPRRRVWFLGAAAYIIGSAVLSRTLLPYPSGPGPATWHVAMVVGCMALILSCPKQVSARSLLVIIVVHRLALMATTPGPGLVPALIDLLTSWVLLKLLDHRGRSRRWVLLFAVHPLVAPAMAMGDKSTSLVALALTLSLWCFDRKRPVSMYTILGFACWFAPALWVLVPSVVRRKTLRWCWVLLLPSLAFFLLDLRLGFTGLPFVEFLFPGRGSLTFALLGPTLSMWHIALILFLGALVLTVRFARWAPEASALCLGTLYLLLFAAPIPTLPLCLLPLMVLVPLRGAVLWTATIGLTFLGEIDFFAIAYGPVLALMLYDLFKIRHCPTLADARKPAPVETVSVVVPTLNEEERVAAFLTALRSQTLPPREVLVCDAGSTDGTRAAAQREGARVLETQRGRGVQIAQGTMEASGDVIVVAHADMAFEAEALERVVQQLNETGRKGGAMGCRFDHPQPFLKLVEYLNRFRAHWMGISFGDQAQFFRRDVLQQRGGFPSMPLMEDVEWSLRMRSLEHPLYLGRGVKASARRWGKSNKASHAGLVVRLVARYLWERFWRDAPPDVSSYYEAYYTPPPGPNGT